MKYIPIIIISVLFNALAQLFLKKGMMSFSEVTFTISNINVWLPNLLKNIFLYFGFSCYAISILIWMFILSRIEVSFAYPFLSIGYVVTAIIGYYAFGESLSFIRIAGIVVICFGVILISRS